MADDVDAVRCQCYLHLLNHFEVLGVPSRSFTLGHGSFARLQIPWLLQLQLLPRITVLRQSQKNSVRPFYAALILACLSLHLYSYQYVSLVKLRGVALRKECSKLKGSKKLYGQQLFS